MTACARPERIGGKGVHVHIDEALLGGIIGAADTGQNSADSVILFGMADKGSVISGIVGDRCRATLFPLIEKYVLPGSILVTDGLHTYHSLRKGGWDHIVVNHSCAWHNFEGVTQSPIEVYWGCVKRCMRGVYQNVLSENLWKYLGEIEFRYNRRASEIALFDELISAFPKVHEGVEFSVLKNRYDWR